MQSPLDLATVIGGCAMAVFAIVVAWWSFHWKAIRQREVSVASLFELALLVVFVLVVAAWLVNTPWPW
jgi:hypothetical protein